VKPNSVKSKRLRTVEEMSEELGLSTDGRDPRLCTKPSVLRYQKDDAAVPPEMWGKPMLDDYGQRQYRPCGRYAMRGLDICSTHGGSLPAVRVSAEKLLAETRDRLMLGLLQIALDETVDTSNRLKAMMWGLERAGFQAGVTVSVGLQPWQEVLSSIKSQFEADAPGSTDGA
jgi:hypothetical protein